MPEIITPNPPQSPVPKMSDVKPVILAGGIGKRLWPLSRRTRPKPYLKLWRKHSFLQKTILRAAGMQSPLIIASADHRDLIIPQLQEMSNDILKRTDIILEPCGRNTAAAIATAAHWLARENPPLLIMPSDHVIKESGALNAAIEDALPVIDQGMMATFGVEPRYAATGYGYIRKGDMLINGAYKIDHFHEKPDKSRAAFYLKRGEHLWNSGIFLARANVFLSAFKQYTPALFDDTYRSLSSASRYTNSIFIDKSNYEKIQPISIDHAVIERAPNVAVVPIEMRWRDIGTWGSLARYMLGI